MKRINILEKAIHCVTGQREQDYGSPEDNFERIANLWNGYFGDGIFTSKDVAMCMILFKVARAYGTNVTYDTLVDIAGYAACASECLIENPQPVVNNDPEAVPTYDRVRY